MNPIPPPGDPTHPRRDAYLMYLPGGVPVLRAAIEELQKSSWDPVFQQRACEISCAFEGAFRASGREDLAAIARSLTLLLELQKEEVILLGSHLRKKLKELMDRMESQLKPEEGTQTG